MLFFVICCRIEIGFFIIRSISKPIIVIEINVKILPQEILENLLKDYCGIHFS